MIIMVLLSWQFLSILLLTIFLKLSKTSFISCMHCPICSWILVDMITCKWTHPNPFHLKSWGTWLHVHIPVFLRWKSDTVCLRMKIAKLRKKNIDWQSTIDHLFSIIVPEINWGNNLKLSIIFIVFRSFYYCCC